MRTPRLLFWSLLVLVIALPHAHGQSLQILSQEMMRKPSTA